MDISDKLFERLKITLRGPAANTRKMLARSNLAARCASLLRNQLDGIVVLHLGHDIDQNTNGEAWIVERLAPGAATFVDVGANVGDWTSLFLAAAGAGARGLLFDPSRSANEHLAKRFQGDARVRILQAAVSNSSGPVTFYEERNMGATSSLVPGFSRTDAEPVVVQSVTLDSALAENNVTRVDYLKIDAEGYDFHVLQGARDALRDRRIRFLQFEYNDAWRGARTTLHSAITLLQEAGYESYLLKGPGLYEFRYRTFGEFYHYSNFVAFPAERADELKHLVRGRI